MIKIIISENFKYVLKVKNVFEIVNDIQRYSQGEGYQHA